MKPQRPLNFIQRHNLTKASDAELYYIIAVGDYAQVYELILSEKDMKFLTTLWKQAHKALLEPGKPLWMSPKMRSYLSFLANGISSYVPKTAK